ncbi:MAG: 6-phosphogluconolactonase [Pseudomonadota bacterium]
MHRFEDRDSASRAAADHIATVLHDALQEHAAVTLVVSGGSTPAPCYRYLAQAPLSWERISIVPSDERCVPADHSDSNARMLRETLLQHRAAAASLVPLEEATLSQAPQPWTLALLGMGTDGHFASLFPDAANLDPALAIDNPALIAPIDTAASPYRRITLTWSALARCDHRLLLIFGDDKARTLAHADDKPIATLLTGPDHDIYWAP